MNLLKWIFPAVFSAYKNFKVPYQKEKLLDMNEQIYVMASNFLYTVPIVMILTGLWIKFQKSKIKHNAKNVILDNAFLIRNVVFVGFVTFIVMHLTKPLAYDDNIMVRPADF